MYFFCFYCAHRKKVKSGWSSDSSFEVGKRKKRKKQSIVGSEKKHFKSKDGSGKYKIIKSFSKVVRKKLV